MTWREVAAALTRRWYVVLCGLLMTAALLALSPLVAPPEYAARGLVVLLPPRDSTNEGGNPFLGLGGLDLPARILVAYYSSNSVQDAISAVSPKAEVTVSIEESTRSPVIAIDVVDSSPESALSTLKYVSDTIPTNLTRLQAEVSAPTDTRVTSMVLTSDTLAQPDLSKLIRMLVAAGVIGLALTGILTFGIDGMIRRRAAERESEQDSTAVPGTTAPKDDDLAPEEPGTTGGELARGMAADPLHPRQRQRRRSRASRAVPDSSDDSFEPAPPSGRREDSTALDDPLQLRA